MAISKVFSDFEEVFERGREWSKQQAAERELVDRITNSLLGVAAPLQTGDRIAWRKDGRHTGVVNMTTKDGFYFVVWDNGGTYGDRFGRADTWATREELVKL